MTRSSDSESSDDSDKGVRYKTDSIRNKTKRNDSSDNIQSSRRNKHSRRRSNSSSSDENKRKRKKERKHRNETKHVKPVEGASTSVSRSIPQLGSLHMKPVIGIRPQTEAQKEQSQAKETDEYGPALASQLKKKSNAIENLNTVIGPVLPPHLMGKSLDNMSADRCDDKGVVQPKVLGPALPPHLRKKYDTTHDEETTKEQDIVGSALSQHLQTSNIEEEKVIGPTLPPHLRQQLAEQSSVTTHDESGGEEEESYGPLPIGAAMSKSHLELEERAWQLKIDQLNPDGDEDPKREEWMLELPAVKAANLGLGLRSFKMKGGPDFSDRSSWTDTPQDKVSKKNKGEKIDLKKEAELKASLKRDQEQEEQVKKSKRSHDSLLEIHRKKLKEKKKDDEPAERRPFSRDIDLQVNKFDEAQKKAVLKKAQLLDDRFSSGQAKFL